MGIWRKEKCVLAAGAGGFLAKRGDKKSKGVEISRYCGKIGGKQANKYNTREGWVGGDTFRRLGWGCIEAALQGSETDPGTYPVSPKKLWDAFQQWGDMTKIKLLYLF